MPSPTPDAGALRRLLPATLIGELTSIEPIRGGLSGAGVYAVSASRGEYVLRVQDSDSAEWSQYRRILDRVSAAAVAPAIVHVDDVARAVLFVRIDGVPLPVVLRDARRDAAIADVVDRLRTVHTINPEGITERDPLVYARGVWEQQRQRSDFPRWAVDVAAMFERIERVLMADPRRVVSHNDVNPGNVLWDGTRSWLVDWDAAGLGHPYYDLAAFVTFLAVDAEQGYSLLARQEEAPLDDDALATFNALRQVVALAIVYSFLSGAPDITGRAPTRADAPTLGDCRAAMRRGELDLMTVEGRATYGLAMLDAAFSG